MNVIVSNKYQNLLSNLNIDVIKSINGVFSVQDLAVQFKNFFFNKMILDITALENYENINTIQKLSLALDMSKVILLLDDSPKVNSGVYLSQLVSLGIYNFTKNIDAITFLMDNPNTYKDVAKFHQLNGKVPEPGEKHKLNSLNSSNSEGFIGQRVLGIRNITEHAGSTTLTYIIKKHLEKLYKVKAIETGKKDFEFFSDYGCFSIAPNELEQFLQRNGDAEVILVDVNSDEDAAVCQDVIYLIEPGIIQLNRLIRDDDQIFEKLKDKKIVLNRSVLTAGDVSDFEKESGSRVFYNIPLVDDKQDETKVILDFLLALGFTRITSSEPKKGFGIFR